MTSKILSATMLHLGDNLVLMRFRFILLFGCAVALGYWLGNGPTAEWLSDVLNFAAVALTSERATRSTGSILPVLAAGFLLGQALFFAVKRILASIEPLRAKRAERLASWDWSLEIGTRFGLHQYLSRCARWAAGDSARRTQTVGLFKIHGLGALNGSRGTLVTAGLLRRVAAEIRVASLPENSSAVRRWLTQRFPRPQSSNSGLPPRRYAARWSGATFALAFREQEAVEAIGLLSELASWIRDELVELGLEEALAVSAIAIVGGPGASSQWLSSAAAKALRTRNTEQLRVLLSCDEPRAALISEMEGVLVEPATVDPSANSIPESSRSVGSSQGRSVESLRAWAPSATCLAGALVLLTLSGGARPPSLNPTWPDAVSDLQVVDTEGARTVRLIRANLAPQSSATWTVNAGKIVQGNPADGSFAPVQVQVSVLNRSSSKYYVSPFDFELIDANGRALAIDLGKTLRTSNGFKGKWLGPGQGCSGWIMLNRWGAPVEVVRFQPDRLTRLDLTSRPEDSSRDERERIQ